MNMFDAALLPSAFPTTWASCWGEDSYGLFHDLKVNEATQRFRWIRPGKFMMGSPESEVDRDDDEIQHLVMLTHGFWLADSACTQALWTGVMSGNPSRFKENPENPVENVSWEDAQQFIQQLNRQMSDLQARLPSEAEWEYACRAGTETRFSFGANITPEQANYDGRAPYADGKEGVYREQTVPVKSLPANAWGLYEMHGNVLEWCQDWYGDYPARAVSDPTGPESGASRVLRGGSWSGYGRSARSAYRYNFGPSDRSVNTGFRLALGRSGQAGRPAATGLTAGAEPGGQD